MYPAVTPTKLYHSLVRRTGALPTIADMRQLFRIAALMYFGSQLTLLASTQALPNTPLPSDWNRVQQLANGDGIRVDAGNRGKRLCRFAGATDDTIFCDSYPFLFRGSQFQVARDAIVEIRHDDMRRNFRIITGSFLAAGFLFGVCDSALSKDGTPRIVNGLAFGAVGGFAGMVVSVPAVFLIPGRLVYRMRPGNSGHAGRIHFGIQGGGLTLNAEASAPLNVDVSH